MIEKELEKKILELRSELKTDRLDMSFGEIMNIYEDGDLIISPEYQRSYRWSEEQKTKFIESILLGIPVPPIFVAEDDDGKWELVDGLQRTSTILSFFGILSNSNKNNLTLGKSELSDDLLENINIKNLPLKLNLTLKRAVCRIEILRWDSKFDMRYELFRRLNTGSSPLSKQEIRNCIYRGKLNSLLFKLSENKNFLKIMHKSDKQDAMYFEELILRYFTVKNNHNKLYISSNVSNYLNSFMDNVNKQNIDFNYEKEEQDFIDVINFLIDNKITKPFNGKGKRFSENIFEVIMLLTFESINKDNSFNKQKFENLRNKLIIDNTFIQFSGDKTSQKERLRKKIKRAREISND